ncbi:MAG: hypothetical protein IKZ64_00600 [Alphaproteobacteria bacterium]|nr:hypothetical protein [Alphaproteobacteria bacterium]
MAAKKSKRILPVFETFVFTRTDLAGQTVFFMETTKKTAFARRVSKTTEDMPYQLTASYKIKFVDSYSLPRPHFEKLDPEKYDEDGRQIVHSVTRNTKFWVVSDESQIQDILAKTDESEKSELWILDKNLQDVYPNKTEGRSIKLWLFFNDGGYSRGNARR